MSEGGDKICRSELLAQQRAFARFGELAVRSDDLQKILQEACRLVSEALGTELAKVLELQPGGRTLLVRAGVGWGPGIVGKAKIKAQSASSEGHALKTGAPVVSTDLRREHRFETPAFVREHGVLALVNVPILGGGGQPAYGVLEVDSREPRRFTEDDVSFLRTYANMLAATVVRLRAADDLRRRAGDVERLLRELQHRVKNNLQVVVGLVEVQARRASDPKEKRALRVVGRRIDALRLLHGRLYETGEADRVDLGAYLADLGTGLLRLHEDEETRVRLVLEVGRAMVSADQAAPLGLIANEFVTNSLKYAFDDGAEGIIGVRLEARRGSDTRITFWDDGRGLPPERRSADGTGMRMIEALARQAGAQAEWGSGDGGGTRLMLTLRRASPVLVPS